MLTTARWAKNSPNLVTLLGDQMSLLKNRPKCGPTHFLSKLIHNFYRGKKLPLNRDSFFFFLKIAQRLTQ
jgi:hypothetical protein